MPDQGRPPCNGGAPDCLINPESRDRNDLVPCFGNCFDPRESPRRFNSRRFPTIRSGPYFSTKSETALEYKLTNTSWLIDPACSLLARSRSPRANSLKAIPAWADSFLERFIGSPCHPISNLNPALGLSRNVPRADALDCYRRMLAAPGRQYSFNWSKGPSFSFNSQFAPLRLTWNLTW